MSSMKDVVLLLQDDGKQTVHTAGDIKIKKFPHQNGSKLHFELGNNLYELQVVQPRRYGSWLINQKVSSSKNVYLGSVIDPKFICLPFFEAQSVRYCPLDQIIIPVEGYSHLPLHQARYWKLDEICDVNDRVDEENVFYKYNSTKTMDWLKSKIQRISRVLQNQRLNSVNSAAPTFVAGFDISGQSAVALKEDSDISSKGEPSGEDVRQALSILSEYLSDDLWGKLLAEFSLTRADVKATKGNASALGAPVKRKADWEDALELEKETLAYSTAATAAAATQKTLVGKSAVSSGSAASQNKPNKSAKVNVAAAKGTKSIQSFFVKK